MQSPFFNVKYPKSINYGAMGVVMGHELSHAFDDQVSLESVFQVILVVFAEF